MTAWPGVRSTGVDDRAATGEDGAPEYGGDVGWDVVPDGYDRMLVDDSVCGETRDAEVMFDVSVVAVQADTAAEEGARVVRCAAGEQGSLPSVRHSAQLLQRGRKAMTTRCPTTKPDTPSPSCSTRPAAS